MKYLVPLLIVGWVTCSALSYGLNVAAFTAEFPTRCHQHARFALKFSVGGPIALLVILMQDEPVRHGFKWSCP